MVSLDFLDEGVYKAEIYADGPTAHFRGDPYEYQIDTKHVGKNESLDIYMAAGGGFAIKLTRENN